MTPPFTAWAIVPVKRLAAGKSRLDAGLDRDQRGELVLAMLRRVLSSLAATPGVVRITVVTEDLRVAGEARACDASVLGEPPDAGLNGAIRAGAAPLDPRHAAMIVPADLPLALPEDFAALLAGYAGPGSGVIVRAKDGGGTGSLLVSLPLPFAPAFGPSSFTRHQAAAEAAGVTLRVLDLPRIAFDIDDPADLDRVPDLLPRTRAHG